MDKYIILSYTLLYCMRSEYPVTVSECALYNILLSFAEYIQFSRLQYYTFCKI